MEKVLITGGSGMIGTEIVQQLISKDFEVIILSRSRKKDEGKIKYAYWDPEKKEIDEKALSGVQHIINLAGANLADGRWTEKKKELIIKSRTESIELMIQKIRELNLPVKTFISASAIGYYGNSREDQSKVFKEDDPPGEDFLAKVCVAWENALQPLESLGIRKVIIRIGLVLSKKGGLMQKILPLAKKALNANFGNGHQNYPWIHLHDVASIFVFALENQALSGPYNAVVNVGNQLTQDQFNKVLATYLDKPFWLPSIPAFILKIAMGEMSEMLLTGQNISNDFITSKGFQFKYGEIEKAFKHL